MPRLIPPIQGWNQIAKLPQNSEFGGGCFGISFFFHLCRVTELKSHSNHFFCALTENPIELARGNDLAIWAYAAQEQFNCAKDLLASN
jgi:hypothetical protein